MNQNANFIDDARQIVRDYFEQRVHYEGIMERAAAADALAHTRRTTSAACGSTAKTL